MKLRLVSVNVGTPRVIGKRDGEDLLSAIAKRPVTGGFIRVGKTNLAGDAQANLRAHGGVDKAVYAYPADNWPWWEKEKGFACAPGTFGENLTVHGADETQIFIGDRFRWGDAVLEVSQPRAPCHKFQLYSGREDAGALMTLSGRCGWYFRVIEEGEAPIAAEMERIFANNGAPSVGGAPSVREAFFACLDPRVGAEERQRVLDTPALAEAWRVRMGMGANQA